MADVIRLQQEGCERAGSALYGSILASMASDIETGGICGEILAPWSTNALADAIPLRFLASVHRIVLDDRAPALAAYYPSAGGHDVGDPWPAFLDVVRSHRDEIEADMHRGVQTNEVGRAATLFGGFHRISLAHRFPLRILEVGASAGLLLRWDQYRYTAGDMAWGPQHEVQFDNPWTGDVPAVDAALSVAERAGCDVNPLPLETPEAVNVLRGFLWPDQQDRRARLDAAIEIARRVPARIDQADAGDWVADALVRPAPGVATVVYHSIVLQYLPRPSFDKMRSAITEAGERATSEAPLCWLRMEPAGDVADVRLRTWPGGTEEVLATTGYHGPPVTWLGRQLG